MKDGGDTEMKLFGVQIVVHSGNDDDGVAIRRSKSLDNLQSFAVAAPEPSGYLSDGYVHQSDRNRGKPWSEEEHRSFLAGLEKLGKGDWKGISNSFVPSRSSTQVASHAQKYFNRLSATEKKRRRTSIFDIPLTHNQPSNKDDQTSLAAAAPKNVIESKQQSKKTTNVVRACSERPPHSPMLYQVERFSQGYPIQTQIVRPTISWVPVVNFSGQGSFLLPSIHGFVPQ